MIDGNIYIEKLSVKLPVQKEYINIINDISIKFEQNLFIGIIGESGCGKSSLAKILLRLLSIDKGKILFCEKNITKLNGNKLKSFRKEVQFISQNPSSFFDPMKKISKSLVEPLEIYNLNYTNDDIENILERVKLKKIILSKYPHQLSGGEIQRVSLARALLLNPQILILDEPTSMLDISVQAQILHLLKELRREKQLSYLFISHDKAIVNWLCDKILVMKNGQLN